MRHRANFLIAVGVSAYVAECVVFAFSTYPIHPLFAVAMEQERHGLVHRDRLVVVVVVHHELH